ncbi:LytTR family DNA-binding domain-containing protein [Loigolactobacillus jiayinensis]|uniref:LytTR family DNA-binding domain-containing protein n=1 Tax=Loigolactobacillus jiayinensis TaxID=2486016 RepID=A0ABW1RBL0_9LACO|nr:LytTR family DNA-binding domain-containing protein [Loigolactobacillus jiayinensis]
MEPLDYIVKDQGATAVAARIRTDIQVTNQRYRKRLVTTPKLFSYQIGSRVYSLPLADVLYIATVAGQPGKLEVHTSNGMVEYSGNLSQLAAKYDQLFRCHKSWLVNPAQVASYDMKKRHLVMRDGSQCEVSFRKESQMRQLLINDNRSINDVNN